MGGSPCAAPVAQAPWIEAKVPGTVLSALVEAGQVPDPYVGTNSEKIQDIGVTGANEYTYWFCAETRRSGQRDGRRLQAGNAGAAWTERPWCDHWDVRPLLPNLRGAGEKETGPSTHAVRKGGQWWLILEGVNYSARVFLNGVELDLGKRDRGMFLRRCIDVSSIMPAGE